MALIRALVVEDEDASRAHICALLAAIPDIQVIGAVGDGLAAVSAILSEQPDLVLLDVQLPELDGFDVLAALPPEVQPAVVFVTAYDEFAIRAFDANAVDYLLKPFSAERFARAVARATDKLAAGARRDPFIAPDRTLVHAPLRRFVGRQGNTAYFVPVETVDWIDATHNYLRLHAEGRVHLVRGTIGGAIERLDPGAFVRIHRGLIVRLGAVATITPVAPAVYSVVMSDGAKLTSSRSYAGALRALVKG